MIQDIKRLNGYDFLNGVLAFVAAVAPGFLILYHFKPSLIEKLDFAKVLLFSTSLSIPILLAQVFLHVVTAPRKRPPTKREVLVSAAVATSFSTYGALLVAYFEGLSFRHFIGLVGGLSIVPLLSSHFVLRKWHREEEAKKTPNKALATVFKKQD